MPKAAPGCVHILTEVPVELRAALHDLAVRNARSMQAEVLAALRRHLARPPVVVVTVTEPDLEDETVTRPARPPARRGRKPQQG